MIGELEKEIPHVRSSMLTALGNVVPSHLHDPQLFDFRQLASATSTPLAGDVEAELDAIFNHADDGADAAALVQIN